MPGTKVTYLTVSINCKIFKLLLNYHIEDCRSDPATPQARRADCGLSASLAWRHLLIGSETLRKHRGRSAASTGALASRTYTWLHVLQIRILSVTSMCFFPFNKLWSPRICVCRSSSRFSVAGLLLCKRRPILDRSQSRKLLLPCYLCPWAVIRDAAKGKL